MAEGQHGRRETFDYIVVGAGASGSVVANRLSEDPGVRVLLLEAGPDDTDPRIPPPEALVQMWGSELDWALTTREQQGMNGRNIVINQGRVLGGSTSIHAMMYVRGNRRDFDGWRDAGADGWGYRDVLPIFKRIEDFDGDAGEFHARGGPLSVRRNPDPDSRSEAFQAAARELGYDGPDWDYNGERQEDGAGPLQFTIDADGRRVSAASAYLRPVAHRPDLEIRTGATATRVTFDGDRATGVEYRGSDGVQRVQADREVIVSAGALGSPKLLMLSGVGPADALGAHGIEVRSDLSGVGDNLQDHVQLPVAFRSSVDAPKPGLLTGNALFVRLGDGDDLPPDIQLNFTPAVPRPLAQVIELGGPGFIFLPILVQPRSVGSVTLASSDPAAPPVIDPGYLSDDVDVEAFRRAIDLIRRLAQTAPLRAIGGPELAPGPEADLEGYIRNASSTLWHPAGTCRMGSGPGAVVDARLRVHGVRGLRVVDASVMPRVTSGNTQAACFMIGEKASDMIREDA